MTIVNKYYKIADVNIPGQYPENIPLHFDGLEAIRINISEARREANKRRRESLVNDCKTYIIAAIDIRTAAIQARGVEDVIYGYEHHKKPVPVIAQEGKVFGENGFKYVRMRFADEYDEETMVARGSVIYVYLPVDETFNLEPETSTTEIYNALNDTHEMFFMYNDTSSEGQFVHFGYIGENGVHTQAEKLSRRRREDREVVTRELREKFMRETYHSTNPDESFELGAVLITEVEHMLSGMKIFPFNFDYRDSTSGPSVK